MMSRELLQQALDALSAEHHFGDYDALCAALREALAAPPAAPAECCRNELLTALHTLASNYENALGMFGQDGEGRRKAEGDLAHAMQVAARHNRNGPGCAAPPAAPASQWMPIETAPKDGTPLLLLTNERWKDCRPGTQFVGINRGDLSEWGFYAPVGMGGIPDAWLDGWMPLPAAPDHFRDVAEKVAPIEGFGGNLDEAFDRTASHCEDRYVAVQRPFPAAPVVREPLQEHEILALFMELNKPNKLAKTPVEMFICIVRAIEAAHGITGASK